MKVGTSFISSKKRIDDYNDRINQEENPYKPFDSGRKKEYEQLIIPNIVSEDNTHYLNNENELSATIPFIFFWLDAVSFDGTITNPTIYLFVNYKDKIKNCYEECFEFKVIGSLYGDSTYRIKFNPKQVNEDKIRVKLYEQKRYLKEDFPNPREVFYYEI